MELRFIARGLQSLAIKRNATKSEVHKSFVRKASSLDQTKKTMAVETISKPPKEMALDKTLLFTPNLLYYPTEEGNSSTVTTISYITSLNKHLSTFLSQLT
ncbi:MAG: hypothetical protein QMD08_05995 [Actinomycetota bacterium]|nr:hypothetical protein [Actinomycetota bacterium]